jgi:DNA-directed DNA polymerase III PolC
MPVALHTHSWYSLLEAVPSPEMLLARAATCGYAAVALTDTNNLYGAVPFTELARQRGIRPLLGACLRQGRAHCVALIAEPEGYRSLCRILSRLHLGVRSEERGARDGETSSLAPRPSPLAPPEADAARLAALVSENAGGLHVLVEELSLAEPLREALANRLWLEVVRPGRTAQQEDELLAAGRRLGLRPVASTAAHLATAAEFPLLRVLTAVRRGALLDQVPARTRLTAEHHLIDADTLRRLFRDLPEAVRNADLLAGQLRSDVLPRDTVLPPPRVPRSLDGVHFLRLLCRRGLARRGLTLNLPAQKRLDEELAVIEAGGLSDYFLVARDIARYARCKDYSMALRGSAGNSLVCYLLEITDVDPLRFGLALERFLHPGRLDLPDIDLDFDWKVRDDVIAHVFRRYGDNHVAMISSHLFLQPRSAFREAGKAHGLSSEQVTRLVETFAQRLEHLLADVSITEGKYPECPRSFPLEPERWPLLMHDARLLLGRPHHLSVHPGGVVITPEPLEGYVPLQRAAKGVIITQFEKDAIEHIGLVKMDLLGNRALSTVDEARQHLRATTPSLPTPLPLSTGGEGTTAAHYRENQYAFPLSPCTRGERGRGERGPRATGSAPLPRLFEDPATLALIRRGDTLGVNQLESPAMRHLLIQMRPTGVEDVIHSLALIRPGAGSAGMKGRFVLRRRGLETPGPLPPEVEAAEKERDTPAFGNLHETHGVLLYQDDAFKRLQALTGLSILEADYFFKRIIKQETEEEAAALAREFHELCAARGIPHDVAAEQWAQLDRFQYYTFCKSHAVSYGLIAWQSAYLKAHHPLCFWTAAINNNQGVYPRRVYIEAIKRAGFRVLLPCVNRSAGPFTPERAAIRVGLEAIATLPEEVRVRILAEREQHGPFRDLADFRRRVAPGPEALATLIRCGALDFTGQPRPALFLETELQQDEERWAKSGGQTFLSSSLRPPPSALFDWMPPDYPAARRLRDEWALLGFVVGPPLLFCFRLRLPSDLVASRDLPSHIGRTVRVAGAVATGRYTQTVHGSDMQFVTLEDEWGIMEITLFPGTCPLVNHLELGPYLVNGVVEDQLGVITVTARSFERL